MREILHGPGDAISRPAEGEFVYAGAEGDCQSGGWAKLRSGKDNLRVGRISSFLSNMIFVHNFDGEVVIDESSGGGQFPRHVGSKVTTISKV